MVFEPVKISLANLTVLTVLRFLFFISLKIFWNFQGCITVYLSRCFAVVLISFDILSQLISFVNNFFLIFLNSFRSSCRAFMPQRLFIITHRFQLVKHFFEPFFKAQLLFNCRNGYWFYQNRLLLSSTFFFFFRSFCRLSRRQTILYHIWFYMSTLIFSFFPFYFIQVITLILPWTIVRLSFNFYHSISDPYMRLYVLRCIPITINLLPKCRHKYPKRCNIIHSIVPPDILHNESMCQHFPRCV